MEHAGVGVGVGAETGTGAGARAKVGLKDAEYCFQFQVR
jgi:hypothetical protein